MIPPEKNPLVTFIMSAVMFANQFQGAVKLLNVVRLALRFVRVLLSDAVRKPDMLFVSVVLSDDCLFVTVVIKLPCVVLSDSCVAILFAIAVRFAAIVVFSDVILFASVTLSEICLPVTLMPSTVSVPETSSFEAGEDVPMPTLSEDAFT